MKETKKEQHQETAQNGQKEEKTSDQKPDMVDAEEKETQSVEKETEETKAEDPAEKIAALEKENAELKDQLLRRAADFDNYRKRMLKEKQEAFDYANTALLQDLLESLDNFDRTVDAASNATDVKSIADGVKMINKNLVSMLETKYNLVSYGEQGDLFNPDEHQAIGSVKGSVAEPVLKEVYLKGYKLKDRVIRHAKVMVTMPDGSVSADAADSDEEQTDDHQSAEDEKNSADKAE